MIVYIAYLSSDINECSNRNPCGLGQRCINTPGSHRCECDTGYTNTSGGCVGMQYACMCVWL